MIPPKRLYSQKNISLHLRVTCRRWFYLSTVLDDFSRYILAQKMCGTRATRHWTAPLGT